METVAETREGEGARASSKAGDDRPGARRPSRRRREARDAPAAVQDIDASIESKERGESKRRFVKLALLGGAGALAAAVAAPSLLSNRAQAGHDGTDVFHLGGATNTFGRGVLQVTDSETALRVQNDGDGFAIHGVQRQAGAAAVVGSGGIGVWGVSQSPGGTAVLGYGLVGPGSAVRGVAALAQGDSGSQAVFGEADSISGLVYGIYGRTGSTNGRGVEGEAAAASGATRGVVGRAVSSEGTGVEGFASAASGSAQGVLGRAASTGGVGVRAINDSSTGRGLRVEGRSQFSTVVDGMVPARMASVTIADSRVNANSNVLVALQSNPGNKNAVSWVQVSAGSFTVNPVSPPPTNVPFRAFIVEKT